MALLDSIKYPGTAYDPPKAQTAGYDPKRYQSTGYTPGDRGSQGYDPAKTKASGYNPGSYGAQGYDANTSGYTGYEADQRNVDPNSLVSTHITDLMGKDSPYKKQFVTGAMQAGNARGLLNSSMTASAGEAAAAQGLLPVAQGNAQAYYGRNTANQDASNRSREYGATAFNTNQAQNQNAINTAKQFTAGETNRAASESYLTRARAGEFGAAAQNEANNLNQEATNRAGEFQSDAANTAASESYLAKARAGEFGAEAQNQANQLAQAATNRASEFGADAYNRSQAQWADQIGSLIQAQQNGELNEWINQQSQTRQKEVMNLEADIRVGLAGVDQQFAVELETITQNYNINEHLTDASGEYYKNSMLAITELLTNTDLTPEQQQQGLNDQMSMLSAGLEFFASMAPAGGYNPAGTAPVIPDLSGGANPQ